MIKEIDYIFDKKNNYQFGEIEIISPILNAVETKLMVDKFNIHYKKELEKFKIIEIKKRKKFKHADVMPIYLWYDFWCVSKKFKDVFEGKLKGYWYPTNDENYFIFLLDNYVDLIDREKTKVYYEDEGIRKPYQYEYIENLTFKEESENEYLFTILELSGKYMCSSKFEDLVKENNLTGIQFYKDINYKRKDGLEFDWLRRKNYNEDGDVIE